MALAYLGAFHEPTPHALPTAVVGTSVEAKVFAQKLNDGAHGALTVRTVPTADDARRLIRQREISGAYQTVDGHAVLFVSPAASATTATAVTEAFAPIAYATAPAAAGAGRRTGGRRPTAAGRACSSCWWP